MAFYRFTLLFIFLSFLFSGPLWKSPWWESLLVINIIIIISFITVSAGVLFVDQPGANHAPRASVTQVNRSVHILSTFLRIRADPSIIIIIIIINVACSECMGLYSSVGRAPQRQRRGHHIWWVRILLKSRNFLWVNLQLLKLQLSLRRLYLHL